MTTMNDYMCRCTDEQTRRAYKLDAPVIQLDIREAWDFADNDPQKYTKWVEKEVILEIPTTQQMIRWLEVEKNFGFSRNVGKYAVRYSVYRFGDSEEGLDTDIITTTCPTEHAAIDAALEYLERSIT